MNKVTGVITIALGSIALVFVILAAVSYPTMLLWNWVVPEIFDLPKITFWQAFGLQVLSTVLVRSYYTKTKS